MLPHRGSRESPAVNLSLPMAIKTLPHSVPGRRTRWLPGPVNCRWRPAFSRGQGGGIAVKCQECACQMRRHLLISVTAELSTWRYRTYRQHVIAGHSCAVRPMPLMVVFVWGSRYRQAGLDSPENGRLKLPDRFPKLTYLPTSIVPMG